MLDYYYSANRLLIKYYGFFEKCNIILILTISLVEVSDIYLIGCWFDADSTLDVEK